MGFKHVFPAAAFLAILRVASYGAFVHDPGLPAGVASDIKTTGNFIYLEPENPTVAPSDTYKDSVDSGHTFYRTGVSPTDAYWGSTANDYNGYRNISRGNDAGSASGLQIYWENLTTNVAAGTYDVYVRAYPSGNGSQTFSLSAADSVADLASGSSTGPATTTVKTSAALTWLKLGSVNLTDTTDSFGLTISTSTSTVRFDTVLLVATSTIPEPASLSFIGLGAIALLSRRKGL